MPLAAVQFVAGFGLDPQQVPRAEIDAGNPSDVTFAPSVAPVAVIEMAVGVVTVGGRFTLMLMLPVPAVALTLATSIVKNKTKIRRSVLIVFIIYKN